MKQTVSKIFRAMGYRVSRIRPPVKQRSRKYDYQKQYNDFDIPEGARVLDVGSGGEPFPYATVLAERFVEKSRHRSAVFQREGKRVVICDVMDLPFADNAFDFVYCSHVLEHLDDPVRACRELQRVGRRGYIETPHMIKDMLFCWGKNMHRWAVTSVANRLVFVEHTERLLDGIRSDYFRSALRSPDYHPFQRIFADNQDIFNTMLKWEGTFGVHVFRRDGSVESVEP